MSTKEASTSKALLSKPPGPRQSALAMKGSGPNNEFTGGVGGIDLSIGQTILNRVVEQQTKTKKELQEEVQRFLGGKGLPFGGTVLPRGGGIQVKGATLPATADGGAKKYGGSIQSAVKVHNGHDPTYRTHDKPTPAVPGDVAVVPTQV